MAKKTKSKKKVSEPAPKDFFIKQFQGVRRLFDEKIVGLESRFDKKLEGLEYRFDKKLEGLGHRFDKKLDGLKEHLELKIEDSRVDARDHLQVVSSGLHKRVDGLEGKMGGLEGRMQSLEGAVLETNKNVNKIVKKVEQHDQDISELKLKTGTL